ncbi:MAG: cytochrome c oxidase subunit II [Bacteroidetes bacterium]|nr:MAG: cytochrome c oxidase subunit II [Bacteroidota bacterium]
MILGASTFVEGVDNAFIFILGISFFFLIGITLTMIIFIYRYNQKRNPKATQVKDSVTLELTWTIIPLILVLGMFYYGYVGWIPMKSPPDEGIEVTANARMWSFNFRYENGRVSDKLYVPVDTAIIVNLNALDVLHSFYIPAFRIKEDMVPGLPGNRTWFQATKTGTFTIFCSEYCGLQHSYMISEVVVMEQDEFWEWYEDPDAMVPVIPDDANLALLGRQVVERNGCLACHSLDGSTLIGPTFAGKFGETITVITDGQERQIVYDEEYVIRSIYDPDYDITLGFRPGQMLSYEGEITEQEVELIIEFLKSLNE